MSDNNNLETIILPFTRTAKMGLALNGRHSLTNPGAEPLLSLTGTWLREAGFKGGQKVKIQYGWQQLVITPVET